MCKSIDKGMKITDIQLELKKKIHLDLKLVQVYQLIEYQLQDN